MKFSSWKDNKKKKGFVRLKKRQFAQCWNSSTRGLNEDFKDERRKLKGMIQVEWQRQRDD